MIQKTRSAFALFSLLWLAPLACAQASMIPLTAARGDGLTDDTAAIQAALNASPAGSVVQAAPGKTYLISSAGTLGVQVPSGGISGQAACLRVPSGIVLDMAGSTLKLRPGTVSAYMVINAHPSAAGGDTECGLMNATLDGSHIAASGCSLLTLTGVIRPLLRNVTVENGTYQGIFCFHDSFGTFDHISAHDFQGQGLQFGTPSGKANGVYDSTFTTITAQNITSLGTFSQPGNSFDAVLVRCTVGEIDADNCAAGVKIQGPGTDDTIGVVRVTGGGDASGNSGLKLQGDTKNGWYPQRVHIGSVYCTGQSGTGLYLEKSIGCTVDNYTGVGNGTLGTSPDLWVDGTSDTLGCVSSSHAGGDALLVRSGASGYRIKRFSAVDPGQVTAAKSKAGASVQGGSGTIGMLTATDDQAKPTMAHGFQNNEPTATLFLVGLSLAL